MKLNFSEETKNYLSIIGVATMCLFLYNWTIDIFNGMFIANFTYKIKEVLLTLFFYTIIKMILRKKIEKNIIVACVSAIICLVVNYFYHIFSLQFDPKINEEVVGLDIIQRFIFAVQETAYIHTHLVKVVWQHWQWANSVKYILLFTLVIDIVFNKFVFSKDYDKYEEKQKEVDGASSD